MRGYTVTNKHWLLGILFGWLVIVGCASGESKITPADIHYGEDLCSECGMIISDPKYASSISKVVGENRYQNVAFDDIGDMLAYLEKHPEEKIAGWFVHDYGTEEWIDATTAFFVISDQVKSPMNHGIAAHASQESAQAMAEKVSGDVKTWDELHSMETTGHNHS